MPEYIPRLGFTLNINKEFNNFEYFGRGPYETYSDFCWSNSYGKYKNDVRKSFTPNARPQSSSNHHKSVWLSLKTKDFQFTISAYDEKNLFDFTYLPFSEETIDAAKHLNELKRDKWNYLHIDYKQHGLGSNACGPVPLKKYWCRPESFSMKQIWNISKITKEKND